MKKIKKVIFSFNIIIASLVSKSFAVKYGIPDDIYLSNLEIIKEPEIVENTNTKIIYICKFFLPAVLLFIGAVVLLNKKIAKKVKIIVASILTILAVAGFFIMNYFANN